MKRMLCLIVGLALLTASLSLAAFAAEDTSVSKWDGTIPEANTAYVFDRQGARLAAYDKTHLFTPMGEHEHYAAGDHLTTFSLDGHKCGLLICYDLRFPELFRTLALQGVELLLLPAQWPAARRYHWETLTAARAIENQLFLAACNSPPPERARRSSPPRSIFPSLRRSATPSTSFTTVGRSYIVSEIKRRTEVIDAVWHEV